MNDFSNQLSPAEAERLAMLIEEASEVQKIACKILRHGYESYNPDKPEDGTNREQLAEELAHLKYSIDDMHERCDYSHVDFADAYAERGRNIAKYTHHQK